MEPIVARRSTSAYAWGVAVGVLVAIVVYLLGIPPGQSLLLGVLMAAGPPAIGLARAALGQGAVLRIDEAGLTDYRVSSRTISWEQIGGTRRSGARLYLFIENPETVGLRKTLWQRMNQPLGTQETRFSVFVRLQGLDVPPMKIVSAIEDRLSGRTARRLEPDRAGALEVRPQA